MLINKRAMEEAEFLVFNVSGGIGKNIMATAVVRSIKKAYPDKKIVVMCGCPEIFMKNPNVYRIYGMQAPVYFYDDFIKNRKSAFLNVEPYQHFDYVYKRRHLVEVWCEMLGVDCDSIYPEIFLTKAEHDLAQYHLKCYGRTMVLCQFEGGKVPEGKDDKSRIASRNAMFRRSLPEKVQTEVVDALNVMGFKVGCVVAGNTYITGCCERIEYPLRAVIALLPYVAGVIAIDSFIQHACACFKKQALVLWSGTSPVVLGYDCHNNIRREVCETPECHRPNSFFYDFEPNGYQWECSIDNKCCDYTAKEVIEEFDKMTNGLRGVSSLPSPELSPDIIKGVNPYDKDSCPDCDKHKKSQESVNV
jgi:hypothetical protein